MSNQTCRICSAESKVFDRARVLGKHDVTYFQCSVCGFVQTEEPYWLEEAYSSAICGSDVGILQRNLTNAAITCSVLNTVLPGVNRAIDFGGGHGIFTRLMRDKGYEFFWWDRHARNEYARGFEHGEGSSYDLLTSFEVLEHLPDPLEEISNMTELADNMLVSTSLLPTPTPKISEWWYYGVSTGQHVALYTLRSLQVIAEKFGRNLVSNGTYHLFTTEPKSRVAFRLATKRRLAYVLAQCRKRPSLLEKDFAQLTAAQPSSSS